MDAVEIRRVEAVPEAVRSLLRGLPEWFGIEEAIEHYIEEARSLPTYAALASGDVVGACLVKRHSERAAEIYLIAVERGHHRQGVGRSLMEAVEADLAGDGVEFLQVKTLGASHPSPEYAATRRFYEALGYRWLEETEDLWPGNPCLIMVKHLPTREPLSGKGSVPVDPAGAT